MRRCLPLKGWSRMVPRLSWGARRALPTRFFLSLLLRAKQRGWLAEKSHTPAVWGARAGSTGRAYPSSEGLSYVLQWAWTLWPVLWHFTAPCHKHAGTAPVKEEEYAGE